MNDTAKYPPARGGARSKNPLPQAKPVSFEKEYTKVKNRMSLDKLTNRFPKPLRRRYASLEDLNITDKYNGPSTIYETPTRKREVVGETIFRPGPQHINTDDKRFLNHVEEQSQRPDVPKIDFTINTRARDEPKRIDPTTTPGNLSSIMESSRSDDDSYRNDSLRSNKSEPDDTMSQLNETYTAIMNFSSEAEITDDKGNDNVFSSVDKERETNTTSPKVENIKVTKSPESPKVSGNSDKSPKQLNVSKSTEITPIKSKEEESVKNPSPGKAEGDEIVSQEEETKQIKYLRVGSDVNGTDVIQAQRKKWNLDLPHIILSVYGDLPCWGTLLEAAESLGAWVMVDGAKKRKCPLHEDYTCEVHCCRSTCIGIGEWSRVSKGSYNKKKVGQQIKQDAAIDERPSHFLFMEGVSSENYYKTRSQLENEMARTLCIPRVVLIHQKEEEESLALLNIIHEAVCNNTPVLFTEKSSLVRDMIQYVIEFQKKNTSVKNTINEEHTTWFPQKEVSDALEKITPPAVLDRQIAAVKHCSQHSERITFLNSDINKKWNITKTLQLEIIEALLKGCQDKTLKKKSLSYALYKMLSECLHNIDNYVSERASSLSAHKNSDISSDGSDCQRSETGDAENTDILIKSPSSWTFLPKSSTKTRKKSQKESVSDLAVVLLGTLLSEETACVEALLNGGVDLKNAPISAILYLYREAGYTSLYEVEADIRNLYGNSFNRQMYMDSKENVHCGNIIEKMEAGFHWLSNSESNKGHKLVTEFDLFIWSIMMNKINITRMLWERGKKQISWALMASHLLQRMDEMGEKASTYCQLTNSKKFTKNACEILSGMYESGPGNAKDILQEEGQEESSPIIVAASTSNRPFLSHVACQSLLQETLCGQIHPHNSIIMVIICVIFPLLIPWLIHFTLNKQGPAGGLIQNKRHRRLSSLGKMKEFYSSPLVKFILHMIFTACLLLLYGYVLLLEMRAFDFSVQELILHVWILSSIVDDIRQIYVKSKERSLKRKLQYHCVSIWNHVEVIGIVLYFVGLSLRLTNTTETFELGRILLCLNFALHAVRVSILYFLHNGLGAKLVILETMAQDLINFLLMFLIVVFSFGIAIQALILREPHIHWSLFSADLFSLPYVYIFQEMNPKSIIGPKNHPNITSSVEVIGAFRTHIALCLSGIYILLSCLLVISLMASLFRRIKTAFNSQQTDGEIHYGPFHFHLVRDYVLKPTLPPPFSVLCYIYNFIHQIISRGVGQQGYALSKHSSPLRLKYLITWQGKIVGEYLSKSKNNNQ